MRKHISTIVLALLIGALVATLGCEPDSLENKDCVVMLGDSIFALSEDETRFLEELSGDSYRHYYVSGAQMTGGMVDTIPEQYETAIAEGPIRTVVLDGGGNDVLIGAQAECSTEYGTELSQSCLQVLDEVSEETEALLERMKADGVQNIIWQGYYYTDNETLWQVADVSAERAIAEMEEFQANNPEINAIYVDPRPHFDKYQASSYTTMDGIHPTEGASETLANLLWDPMVVNNIEQGQSCDDFQPPENGGCN
ncbi:MAG: SGNH/GDSL hydrolase family protein [Desulfobacteraceae bacterium]|nr:SGNH/GDSL hydrolase family protein [Desulfobacteraceae bacterium]